MHRNPNATYTAVEAARVQKNELEQVVLQLTEPLAQPTVLRGSAAFLWELVRSAGASGLTVADILKVVAEVPDDTSGSIAADVQDFLDQLELLGLIRVRSESPAASAES